MSEHLLHAPKVRTVLHQMRRKGMTQRVRRDVGLNIRFLRIMLDQLPESLPAHGLSGTVRKQHLRLFILEHFLSGSVQIFCQRVLCRRTEGNNPLLVAVAAEDEIHLHIHIGQVQRNQLRHPDSRSVEKFQHRLVTDFFRAAPRRLFQ